MGAPIDINLPPDQLKASISQALNNTTEYGVFQPNPRYPNRRVWTGEMEVQIGDSVSLKWDPKLREGYIDVEGAPGKNMKDLFSDFDKAREGLPKGKFLMSPGEAKDAQGNVITRKALKHKLYARKFKNDSQVTLNEDLGLRNRPGGSIESFTLDTTKGGNVSINKNDVQGQTGARFTPDSDGIYRIKANQAARLKAQLFGDIKANKFSKAGLNLTDRIEIDGEARDLRWKGRTGENKDNVGKWSFDRVDQKKAALKLRTDKIKTGTLTIEEFQDGASELFTEEGIEEGGKITHLGKQYTKDQFAKLKFKGYKTKLRTAKNNIKQLTPIQKYALGISGTATGGHLNAPGEENFIESDLNYMAEQGEGAGGNYGNQNIRRNTRAMKLLGINQTRQQFIQNELRGTQRRFSDSQKAITVQGGGSLLGGVSHRVRLPRTNRTKLKLINTRNITKGSYGGDVYDNVEAMQNLYDEAGIDRGNMNLNFDPFGLLQTPPIGGV